MEAIVEANEVFMKAPKAKQRKKTADLPPNLKERAEVIQVLHRFYEAEKM